MKQKRGRRSRAMVLPTCRKCGMDSGKRMMTSDSMKYVIICETCGFSTKLHETQAAATREWNGDRNAKKD